MAQTIKLVLGGKLLEQVLAAAAADEISNSEAIRRMVWCHFEAPRGIDSGPSRTPIAAAGPLASPAGAETGPTPALGVEREGHRSSSLPRPLPSPPGRDLPKTTKATETAEAKASAVVELLSLESTGRAPGAPAHARPGSEPGVDPRTEPGAASVPREEGPAPRLAPEPPPVLVLPCRASRPGDSSSWGLSQLQVERWQVVFAGLDVLGEARKAEAWLHANPGRWKTPRGLARFLFSWLERANDGGRFARREGPAGALGARRSGWNPGTDPPPAPPPLGSLREAYGRDSWEEWEAELRAGVDEPEALEKCLADLAKLRRRWEAKHAA